MLENIELFGNSLGTGTYPDGEGKSFLQNIFDVIHPVGEVYIQYPAQKSPQEIYNKKDANNRIIIDSVWEEQLQYNSAFFRSEHLLGSYVYKANDETQYYLIDNLNNLTPINITGNSSISIAGSPTAGQQKVIGDKTYQAYAVSGVNSSSNNYIEEGNSLIKQDCCNKKHNHGTNNNDTVSVSVSGTAADKSLTGNVYKAFASSATCDGICEQYAYEEKYSMSGSTGGFGRLFINASHGHSVSASGTVTLAREGDSETRPDNFTIRIYKRIS